MRYQYDSTVRAVRVPSLRISLPLALVIIRPAVQNKLVPTRTAPDGTPHRARPPRAPRPHSRSCDAAAMALGGVLALARRRSLARLARPRAVATAIAPSRDHDRDDLQQQQHRHHHPPRRRARAFVVSPFALEPPPPAPPPATPPRAWSSRGFAASAGAPGPPTATTPGTPGTPAAAAAADAPLPLVIDARSESELEDAVARASRAGTTVVFDFYANWCGPCKVLTPKLEALVRADAAEAEAEAEASASSNPTTPPSTSGARPSARGAHPLAVLVKVDVDALPGVSDQLRIKSLPTVMLFSRGRFLDQFEGVLPDDALAAYVAKAKALALETRAGGGGPDVRTDVDRTSGDFGDASPSAPSPPPPPLDAAGEVAAAHEALRAAVADGALAKAAADAASAAAGAGGGASAGEGESSEAARFASAAIARALDPSMHAGPATRAEAYAAAAIIGLLGGGEEAGSSARGADAAGARAAMAAARAEIDGTFPEPDAVTRAGALVELFLEEAEGAAAEAAEVEGEAAEAAAAEAAAEEAAEGGARAAASGLLRSARAAALRGDFEAAVADALGAVKKGERERGRAACVRLFEALGHAHPLTVSGRKKLSNVWFL